MKKKIDFRNILAHVCLKVLRSYLLCEMDGDVHILFEIRSRRLNATVSWYIYYAGRNV